MGPRRPPDLGPGEFGPGKGRRQVKGKRWPFLRVTAETAIHEGACMGWEFKPQGTGLESKLAEAELSKLAG